MPNYLDNREVGEYSYAAPATVMDVESLSSSILSPETGLIYITRFDKQGDLSATNLSNLVFETICARTIPISEILVAFIRSNSMKLFDNVAINIRARH